MALNAKVKVKPESNELTAEEFIVSKIGFGSYKHIYSLPEVIAFMEEYAKYRNGKS